MKILIMTVTAGYGHNSTAKAIKDELVTRGATVETLDVFAYIGKLAYNLIDKGYELTTKYTPSPYRRTYELLESDVRIRQAVVASSEPLSQRFKSYFKNYTPDAVVCTHPFAAGIANELKQKYVLNAPVIGVVTDYTIHPFWDTADLIEYIMTPSELLVYTAERMDIDPGRLLPFGIPINPKFNKSIDKTDARIQLGLDPYKTTILVMGGSMGFGKLLEYVEDLDSMRQNLQVVCICGNNRKLFRKLTMLKTNDRIALYGFVNNIEVFMSASDMIVTKPGGLTCTEALVKGLPMVLVDPIPGQEERNCDFLTNNGAAMRVNESFSITEVVSCMLYFPHRVEMMKKSMELITHSNATVRLADFIFNNI